ncbi:UNVERIFIED_CONTAM: hypothetical protein Sradi_2346300 [Sesamum radiatum]|uniref:Uncharacterized protein n=1 Tax=Sesamum radiatum TaxID=300843 RepID=A0AAW2T5B7_SESRA
MAMNIYWEMAFILPKFGKLKNDYGHFFGREFRMLDTRKVAWSQVCKTEGRLGVQEIRALNLAMMSRRLWDVVNQNRASLWVQWIYHFRLRGKMVSTISVNTSSWGWRKMIRLRDVLLPHVLYHIGVEGHSRFDRTLGINWIRSSYDSQEAIRSRITLTRNRMISDGQW